LGKPWSKSFGGQFRQNLSGVTGKTTLPAISKPFASSITAATMSIRPARVRCSEVSYHQSADRLSPLS